MKKIILTAVLVVALCGAASAAPLMDFEKGNVALEYTYRPSLDFSGTATASGYIGKPFFDPGRSFNGSLSHDFSGDANLDLGLTFGIGNRLGLQYRQYNPTGNIWSGRVLSSGSDYLDASLEGKMRSEEFNLLYGIDKNWAAFIGVVRSSGGVKAGLSGGYSSWTGGVTIPELWSNEQNNVHFGVVGSTVIAPKTHLWGLASFGGDYRNWEAGLAYDIGRDVQLNVNYRDTKWEKIKVIGAAISPPAGSGYEASSGEATTDISAKGWGFGITYKF